MERRLSAIVAADVVGYSALMEKDEAGTFDRVRARRKELFEPEIERHHGRIFKLVGDGLLVEFGSVVDAVECAVSLQNGMTKRNNSVPHDQHIVVRIAINLGEMIVEGDDRYGEGVNLVSGLQQLAEPGGILITGKVFKEVEKKLAIDFEPMGERHIKNIAEPVAVFRVAMDRLPGRETSRSKRLSLCTKPSIAVLPFTNMSNDPEQEYFSEGITEDVITDLSKISGLHVVARNTVFFYKGKPIKVQQVAQELGVDFVLEGSVRKAGSRVRVTGQLIDSEDGAHLWADRFDRDLTDIFAIQDEITRAIVEQLKVKLLPEERKRKPPTGSVEAYGYYLRGRQFLHRRSKSYLKLAKRMFAKAVELDPCYARAYAGIADSDSFLFLHYNADVAIEDILATSAKALELERGLAEAHASRGLALSLLGRYPEAMAELDQAIALDPNLFEAHYFSARACFAQGKLDEAARHFQRAAEVKPDDCQALLVLTGVLRSLGREQDMLTAAREGVARAERELSLHPENPRPAYLGAVGLAILGELDRAKEWADRAIVIDPDDVLTQYNVACFSSLAGAHERAIDLLLALVPRAGHQTKEWIKHDSDLEPIRSHPRFAMVLEMIG